MEGSRVILSSSLVFLLLLLSGASSGKPSSTATPCPPSLSVLILESESQVLDNGSLAYRGHVYPTSATWRDAKTGELRGCICEVASKPCMRKCCPAGELIPRKEEHAKDNKCVVHPDSKPPIPIQNPERVSPVIQREMGTRPYLDDWFVLVEDSYDCDGNANATWLDPEHFPDDDGYEMRANGTLWWPLEGELPISGFCVDRQLGKDELTVIACLAENVLEEDDYPLHIMWIGYFLSLPFLLVTFLVYAIIPELRNIYGKTLMCYVLSLFLAYASICASRFSKTGDSMCQTSDNRSIEKRSAPCDKFELYNSCSPSCEKICDDLNNDNRNGERCDATKNDCVEKCVCKKGFVRENLNGKCIRIQECPRVKH